MPDNIFDDNGADSDLFDYLGIGAGSFFVAVFVNEHLTMLSCDC
jgi:hypothetical protein